MFCPKCGLQQVSEDIRFCSRCGQPIGGLGEWLAGGAMTRTEKIPLSSTSPRRQGIRRGGKLMFFSAVFTPIFLAMSFMVDGPAPLLLPFFAFLAGLALMIYARLFLDEVPMVKVQMPPYSFGTMPPANALYPASNIGVNNIGTRQIRTSELAQPSSVTENTTRLLNNETEPDR